jgi:hypothetical protein
VDAVRFQYINVPTDKHTNVMIIAHARWRVLLYHQEHHDDDDDDRMDDKGDEDVDINRIRRIGDDEAVATFNN